MYKLKYLTKAFDKINLKPIDFKLIREIRNILASFNLTVVRLIRNSFGPISLDNLQTGESKKLKLKDYDALRDYWT